jgi:crotonobetainyl-CoA:carnitine CoA-transferase CaiB-like acyl-CoA transferase
MASSRPLSGVRIIAVEQYGAGPWATMQLADLGAEVIKIEDPTVGGDVSRSVPPYAAAGDSLFFEAFNRGKRSVSLNLAAGEGQVVLRDLVRESDVLFCNDWQRAGPPTPTT